MQYRITKQYTRGGETQCAQFNDLSDAKSFIQTQLREDKRMNVKIIYRIFTGMELFAEFGPDDVIETEVSGAGQGQGTQSGKSQTFRPTPLNMTPRPPGSPPHWLIDEEDDKDKDKK